VVTGQVLLLHLALDSARLALPDASVSRCGSFVQLILIRAMVERKFGGDKWALLLNLAKDVNAWPLID